MNQFKKCKVVMLETTGLNTIISIRRETNEMINIHPNAPANRHNDDQHLYITSDEEIKEGDWYINLNTNKIDICNHHDESISINKFANNYCIKIIATTDTSLKVNHFDKGVFKDLEYLLPKPSQQFIEKYIEEYNKGNVITDILVEYEEYKISKTEWFQEAPYICKYDAVRIKTNPKDNTITIKKVKDSWNREEVIEFGLKCVNLGIDLNNNPLPRLNEMSGKEFYNNWIEQNL